MEFNWVNGKNANSISLLDRAYLYGDGFFTTAAIEANTILLEELHLERIKSSCERLGFNLDFTTLRRELDEFIAFADSGKPTVLKMIFSRQQTERGFIVSQNSQVNRVLQLSEYSAIEALNVKRESGLKLCLANKALSQQPLLAGLKHLSRLENIVIANSVDLQVYDEALVFDCDENVIEGLYANVIYLKDNQVISPELKQCGVEGVMKSCVKSRIENNTKFIWLEKNVSIDDLLAADAIFMTNCILGLVHVKLIDGFDWQENLFLRESFQKQIGIEDVIF